MEKLPPGPYDLAECDDGPDIPQVKRWRVIAREHDLVEDVKCTIDQFDDFLTEDAAQAAADAWQASCEETEHYHYFAYVEEYEIEDPDWDPRGAAADEAFERYTDR